MLDRVKLESEKYINREIWAQEKHTAGQAKQDSPIVRAIVFVAAFGFFVIGFLTVQAFGDFSLFFD
ncbi:MAG TPA: hypothetical protein PKD64_11415 [Pirellulaceae bacterium]|nr:hypothetical protein [Pirellulaceae bacterium]HMO92791.1 hypothetical protein [Pirellulaceae bacterium]HMP69373.1 hypothetical protein [Pirellulaceae bacterium]